jgi:hypothetical protein
MPKFRINGVIRLSRSQLTVKVYSDKYGFVGLAQKNEILKLFRGEIDHVDIVVFDDTQGFSQPQTEQTTLKVADPENLKIPLEIEP